MSTQNLPTLPDVAPSYLAELIKNNPALAAAMERATSGISAGAPPMISTKGTWFTIKEGGTTTLVTGKDGQPLSSLGCIILDAKAGLEKRYYASAYDPKSEPGPPDCQSFDGIKPDPGCAQKQNESCAGCWANVFGSGTNAKGEPAGKACSDLKKLAIFANGKVYGVYITPGSLKNWRAYAQDLTTRGVPFFGVITTISFDIETPQVLTFTYTGMLDPAKQLPKVIELIQGEEVKDVLTFNMPAEGIAPKSLPTPEPEKAAEPAKAVPTRSKKETVKPKEQPKAAEPQLDLGLPGEEAAATAAETVVIETTAVQEEEVVSEGPSDAEIAAALGL